MAKQEIEAVRVGRLLACKKWPYFSKGLWALNFYAYPGDTPVKGTMGCDEFWRVAYDPDAVAAWSPDATATTLAHELQHLLRHDHQRMRAQTELDPHRCNIAQDCAINDDMEHDRLAVWPFDVATPKKYGFEDGLFAETYFDLLAGQTPPGPGRGPGDGGCGPCATGDHAPFPAMGPPKATGNGEKVKQGISAVEAELIRRAVANDIVEYGSKGKGSVPAGLRRWADETLHPKVDWTREISPSIRRAVAHASGVVDYTYRRPSRRQWAYGTVIMPAMVKPIVDAVFIQDTSGSMANRELARGEAEIAGALRSLGSNVKLTVMSCDAAVNRVQRVFNVKQVEWFGGGGSCMEPAFEAAAKLRPGLVVCITDTGVSWPAAKAASIGRVIVVATQDGPVPKWVDKVIRVRD